MTRTFRTAGLFLVSLTVSALTLLPARVVRSQVDKQDDKPWPIEGAWKLLEAKNGDSQSYEKLPEGTEQIKYVTGRPVHLDGRQRRPDHRRGGRKVHGWQGKVYRDHRVCPPRGPGVSRG